MQRLFSLSVVILALLSSGCSTISGIGVDNNPKPSPLVHFTPTLNPQQLWLAKTGKGSLDFYLKLAPAYTKDTLFTVDTTGKVTANRVSDGQHLWSIATQETITSSPAAAHGLVLIGTQTGWVIALDAKSGQQQWKTQVPGQIIAPITLSSQYSYVKTLDGNLCALDNKTGQSLWMVTHTTPQLILRGSSAPQVTDNLVIAGFADGKLVAFNKHTGQQRWERTIAMPQGSSVVERMVDIDIAPRVSDGIVYVASYQGNLSAIKADTGELIWEHPLSSYAGLALDNNAIYISDADSHVLAFARKGGHMLWKQDKLYARRITGPVIMDNTIVVADAEGYLHWLATDDGHFLAHTQVAKQAIIANPRVINGNVYVTTVNGYLAAY